MKNYLLTIVGEFKEETPVCKEIAVSISPLVDSQHLKFAQKNGVLFLSFGTEVDKVDIYDYVLEILYGITDTFVLTEVSDNLTVNLPDNVSGHLFDLDNPGQNNDYSIDMKGVLENTDLYDDYDEDDIDISFSNEVILPNELASEIKSKISQWMGTPATKTTLDSILDKINVLGMDSLTKHELTLLQNYSNS